MSTITRRQQSQRRVTPEQWADAQASWKAGEPWASEWREWRHLAATEAGIIDAPEGSQWDQWDDDEPSQRAILIRAIRETPDLLRSAIRAPGVRSWAAVCAVLVRGRDRIREAADDRDWLAEQERQDGPTKAQATTTIRRLLTVVDADDRRRITEAIEAGQCPTCGHAMGEVTA